MQVVVASAGDDDADDNDLFGFAADWLMRKGPFEFQGEWFIYDIERGKLVLQDADRGGAAAVAENRRGH